ncbi:DoxX family membrane protein, partial [Schumannella luteola]
MSTARTLARIALGGALVFAGITHLTVARQEFQAQVPDWVPLDPDTTVVASGVAEITLGTALAASPRGIRPWVGAAASAFFVAI